ncbi:MAG TPA: GH3 auxin-responsive promoter family protein [Elusimicrobiota bacterium]|nr:GH3 auxin-responsive promoter family protein [Elusimicrobiota bacterium]
MIPLKLAQAGLRAAALPARRALEKACADPESAQDGLLRQVAPGMGYAAFRDRVPVADQGPLEARLALRRERSFDRAFLIWIDDVFRHADLHYGKAFFVDAPAGGIARRFADRFSIAPPGLARLESPENRLDAVCLHLLAHGEQLELVSLPDPAGLLSLLDRIAADRAKMARAWKSGVFRAEGREFPLPAPCEARLKALESGAPWGALWHNLALISCRTDAQAQAAAARLRELFPAAVVQRKGLSAVEAPVTVPLVDAGGCVPLLSEVFLEFEREDGRVLRAHELEPDGEYAVLVSQAGGLLRRRLGDRVRVGGRYRRAPRLAFAGRAGAAGERPQSAAAA